MDKAFIQIGIAQGFSGFATSAEYAEAIKGVTDQQGMSASLVRLVGGQAVVMIGTAALRMALATVLDFMGYGIFKQTPTR